MKPWLDQLVPPFLRRLDGWLLTHRPALWRTRAHFILFYGLLVSLGLFLAGWLIPLSPTELKLDPTQYFRLTNEKYFAGGLLGALLGLAFWGYLVHRYRDARVTVASNAAALLLYLTGAALMLGTFTLAYRAGTILQTAHGLMAEEDLQTVQEAGFYAYGYAVPEDTRLEALDDIDQPAAFRRAEVRFRQLIGHENHLLTNRYWPDWEAEGPVAYSFRGSAWDRMGWTSHILNEHGGWDGKEAFQWYEFQREELKNLSSLADLELMEEAEDWHLQTPHPDRGMRISYLPAEALSRYKAPSRNYWHHYLERYALVRYSAAYDRYYWREAEQPPQELLARYDIPFRVDTFEFSHLAIHLPRHVYQLEDLTRSVLHARHILDSGLLFRHLPSFLPFILLLGLMGLGLPYLKLRSLFGAAFTLGALYFAVAMIGFEWLDLRGHNQEYLLGLPILMVAIGGLWGMARAQRQKARPSWMPFALHLCWAALPVCALVWADEWSRDSNQAEMWMSTLLLYGLLATVMLLYPRIAQLPKRK